MNENIDNTANIENNFETTTAHDTETTVDEAGRMFTQEEVNRIVSERLAKDRARAERKEQQESNQIDSEREKAIIARESALNCHEYVLNNNYPSEFLKILDTSDFEGFKEKADQLTGVFCEYKKSHSFRLPMAEPEKVYTPDLQSAFNDTKHKPKKFEKHGDDYQ